MATYKPNKKYFVNPYNFVKIVKKRSGCSEPKEGLITGFFDCSIEVKTPIAIPDTIGKEEKEGEHCRYPFLMIDKKPTIPASSLRGCIRSAYETVTGSCMGTLNENSKISRRIGFERGTGIHSGILKKQGDGIWKLYKAKRYAVVINDENYKPFRAGKKYALISNEREKYIEDENGNKLCFGETVYFKEDGNQYQRAWEGKVTDISKAKKTGYEEGVLYLGEPFPSRKHAESVFIEERALGISDSDIKQFINMLDNTIKEYRSKAINRELNKVHYGYKDYEKAKEKGIIPVWYREKSGKILSISLAAIGRIEYQSTMGELTGGRCKDRKCVCKACSLFGLVGESGKEAAGKIRFTDAVSEDMDKMDKEYTTLKELGTPRPGYLQFYSKDGMGYDEDGAEIRGRKYYWHVPAAEEDDSVFFSCEKTERNGSFILMRPRAKFSFRIYFDQISEDQLNELAWVINLGDDKVERCHHIGHGKPLGLGSVKMQIKKTVQRKIDDYSISEIKIQPKLKIDPKLEDIKNDFLFISEYRAVEKRAIMYPNVEIGNDKEVLRIKEEQEENKYVINDNVLANHQWYTYNRSGTNGHNPMCLPTIHDVKCGVDSKQLEGLEIAEWNVHSDFKKHVFESGGIIQSINYDRDFGFIKTDDGKSVYFKVSKFKEFNKNYDYKGKSVEVSYFQGERGFQAKSCKLKQ